MPGPGRRPAWPHAALAAYVVLAIVSLVWPGFGWIAGRLAAVRVLGLPFAMAWVAAWSLASFVALGAYMMLTEREGDA